MSLKYNPILVIAKLLFIISCLPKIIKIAKNKFLVIL